MEDAATAEIARSQIWQWLRHGRIEREQVVAFEDAVLAEAGEGRWDEARAVFDGVALAEEFAEFLTVAGIRVRSTRRTCGNGHAGKGSRRPYTEDDVVRLRGSVHVEHTLAGSAPSGCGSCSSEEPYVAALGALTGGQAVQMVKAGLQAIYLSGWQVAADANLAGATYPDQSLYPSNSAPALVRRLNKALLRADQIEHVGGQRHRARTGSRRSSPTPRPASAARSTRSS